MSYPFNIIYAHVAKLECSFKIPDDMFNHEVTVQPDTSEFSRNNSTTR